jgi:Peptidase family C25/Bacterial Ig domain/Propeptide_C25/Viral BACON domain
MRRRYLLAALPAVLLIAVVLIAMLGGGVGGRFGTDPERDSGSPTREPGLSSAGGRAETPAPNASPEAGPARAGTSSPERNSSVRIVRYRGKAANPEKPVRGGNPARPFLLRNKVAGRAALRSQSERVAIRAVRMKDGKLHHRLALDGFHRLSSRVGEPELPEYRTTIRIPRGARVKVVVGKIAWVNVAGVYDLAPVQRPHPDMAGFDDASVKFEKNAVVYKRNSFGTKPCVELVKQMTVRSRDYAVVVYRPLAYNPVTRKLRAAGTVDWHMQYDLPAEPARARRDPRGKRAPDALDIRPAEVARAEAALPAAAPAIAPAGAVSAAAADYLMIVHDNFVDEIQPLATWWHKKGLRVFVAGYPSVTGSGEDAVFTYVQNAYNAGVMTSYVLIVGDHENVPSSEIIGHPYHGAAHVWHTDLRYACVDGGDDYPDLALGRFSCDSEAQVTLMVNKTLMYDRTPPAGSWYKEMVGAGQNQAGRWFEEDIHRVCDFMGGDFDFFGAWNGYAGADPFNKGYVTHVAVNGYLDPYYASSYPLRITPPDPVPASWKANGTAGAAQISGWINAGVSFVMHRDHGGTGGWGTPSYSTGNVNALANGDKLPIVFSINCLTGQFDNGDNFGEAWIRNANGGAVGFFGHQRVSYSYYNDALHVGMMDAVWTDYSTWASATYVPSRRLGELNNYARHASGYTGTYGLLTARMMHLLGDPALQMRTEQPQTLTATHPASLQQNTAASFAVNVKRGGTNCAGAIVALVLAPSEYHVATTDAQGDADFSFTPTTAGAMSIVASALDSIPYQGTITVNAGGNAAPTISNITDQTTDEDVAKGPVAFTVSDAETPAADLTLSKGCSNTMLVPLANIVFGGSGENRTVTLTPAANKNGSAVITVTVTDGGGESAADVFTLTVDPVNDAPVADAQAVSTEEDTPKDITLTGSDQEGSALTFHIVTGPGHGTLNGTGATRTYIPALNYHGGDSFTFRVKDGDLYSAPATVTITVTSVNDAPVISTFDPATPFTMNAGDTQVFSIAPHDDDGDPLSYSWKLDGGATADADDDMSYSPVAGDIGMHTIEVTVSDGQGGSDSHSWSVTVNSGGADPCVALSSATLSAAVQQGANAADQSFLVWNAGGGTLNYTVGDNQGWLAVTPATGDSDGEQDTLTVGYSTAGLAAGSYTATVTVSDPGSINGSCDLTVNLTVTGVSTPDTPKKKDSGGGGGGGGGGCSSMGVAASGDPFVWLLPYLGMAGAWLLSRIRRRKG